MKFYTFCKCAFYVRTVRKVLSTKFRHGTAIEPDLSGSRNLKTWGKAMKLTSILMLAACLQISAKTLSQTVTYSGKQVMLSQVLNAVKKQTGYVFFYNKSILRNCSPMNVTAVNQPLETFLDDILKERHLAYSIEEKVIIISRSKEDAKPQKTSLPDNNLKGRITDEKGHPLPGVTVKIKGTNKGTITNADGTYNLADIPDGSVLEVSFMGFQSREINIQDRSIVDLQLQPVSKDIEGVTVVGYTSKNVKLLSSSVSTVSGDKLRDVTSNDLASLLQGKAPGVTVSTGSGDPTTGATILIRGQGTLGASSSPLVVVDGNIGGTYNPNDIESVTILKDAAATGLYGSRAANGVIIVTTKQGKTGSSKLSFSSTTGFNKANFGKFKLMDSRQLYDYQQTFTSRPDSVLNTNTDWLDLGFRTGMTQSYTLSASGGSDKTQFFASGNYYSEEGTLLTNKTTVYSFRTNVTQKLTDKLKASVLVNGLFTKNNNQQSSTLYDAYTNLPWDNPYYADGTPRPGSSEGWLGRDQHNFLHSLQYNLSYDKTFEGTGDLNIDYAIVRHFTISSYNRVYFSAYKAVDYYDRRSQEGTADNGYLYNENSYSSRLLSSNRLRYDNSFGKHNLSILAVQEGEKYYYDVNTATGRGLPQGMTAMSTATEVKNNPTGGNNQYSFSKYLTQADYNLANKYFLVASFVYDISSKFGNNNPGGSFYQFGASWILTNEPFLAENNTISFLKIRLGHGTVGNPPSGDYQALGLYSYDQSASYAGEAGSYPSQKGNPDLTWEKIRVNNLGFDVSFLKERIALTADVYDKKAKSLLMTVNLPYTSGYSSILENIGSVSNKGLELIINTRNLVGKFKWETSFNIAANRNKVLKLNGNDKFANPGARQPVGLGEDMDKWYMRKWAGVDPENGDPLWEKIETDQDGKQVVTQTNSYNKATLQYTGTSAAAKFTGGITNTFSYNGISLSFFFNFVSGNQVYNNSRQFFDSDGLYDSYNQMVLAKGWNRWQKAGDKATHPKPLLGGNKSSNQPSSRYLEDGSYLRLRNVRLAYSFPKDLLSRINISNARIFVSGDNLLTFTRFSGMDPEVNLSSGESGTKYPISRKVLFGVNVEF